MDESRDIFGNGVDSFPFSDLDDIGKCELNGRDDFWGSDFDVTK